MNSVMRSAPVLAGMVGLLVWPAGALAVRSGGHNAPTRKLEAAFKVAGGKRAASEDGCYPAPRPMAAAAARVENEVVAARGGRVMSAIAHLH